jgi:MSHA biogenesis protein MshL
MKRILAIALVCGLAACAVPPRPATIDKAIAKELDELATARKKPARDPDIEQALIPPLRLELPKVDGRALEPRFDLSVSAAPAQQVFLSIVTGTRYSMLVHPEVSGTISVNLKDVTVREALDSLRDLYGFEYRIDGSRIFVQSAALQTRVFKVNYLVGQRVGRSDVRVISGSVADSLTGPATQGGISPQQPANQAAGLPGGMPQGVGRVTDSSRVSTSTRSDFWKDLDDTLKMIVTPEGGRSVVVNPQAGVIVVRGMPTDIRSVEAYLRAIKLSVERQVMLEAKIVEVTLSESFQAGINWAAFPTGRLQFGVLNGDTLLRNSGSISTPTLFGDPANRTLATGNSPSLLAGVGGGSLFGLALQTGHFASLLEFLEGQGSAQVLSSPRIATLNNQKAVLKVGTDEFFVTNVASGTSTSGVTTGATTSFPTLTLQPFFSGVALDITPQIDEASNVILHIHPSVSSVVQDDRRINLGTLFGGNITLPLARSTVSETDSIVKVADGNIVAIGGLMKMDIGDRRSGLPGVQDIPIINNVLGNRARLSNKKELVILIKPTIVHGETDPAELSAVRDRLVEFGTAGGGAPRGAR